MFRMRTFMTHEVACQRRGDAELDVELILGAPATSLDELLRRSDYVGVHCPYNA